MKWTELSHNSTPPVALQWSVEVEELQQQAELQVASALDFYKAKFAVMSEDSSDASDSVDQDSRSEGETDPLSRRISDMIDEAFPLPIFANASTHSVGGGSEDTNSATQGGTGEVPPPAYTPPEKPPRYTSPIHLTGRLIGAHTAVGPMVPIQYRWLSMIDSQVLRTHHDLMLLGPMMPFDQFLQTLRDSITAYVLSERSARRLRSGEKVVFVPLVKQKTHRVGLFRRRKVVRSSLRAENWPVMLTMLGKRPEQVKLKVSFWTETPGSAAEILRQQRVESGHLDTVSFMGGRMSILCD